MDRKLPIVRIEGTAFIVDLEKDELRQEDRPVNTIQFGDMVYANSQYNFHYDTFQRTLRDGDLFYASIVPVQIPEKLVLDPEGMSEKYHIPLESIGAFRDADVVPELRQFLERMRGVLPIIRLIDKDYIVDINRHELRAIEDPTNRIELRAEGMTSDGLLYRFFYDVKAGRETTIDDTITRLPQGVVILAVPTDSKLDPFGFLMQKRLNTNDITAGMLRDKDLSVKFMRLSETNMVGMVAANRIKAIYPLNWPKLFKRKKGKRM